MHMPLQGSGWNGVNVDKVWKAPSGTWDSFAQVQWTFLGGFENHYTNIYQTSSKIIAFHRPSYVTQNSRLWATLPNSFRAAVFFSPPVLKFTWNSENPFVRRRYSMLRKNIIPLCHYLKLTFVVHFASLACLTTNYDLSFFAFSSSTCQELSHQIQYQLTISEMLNSHNSWTQHSWIAVIHVHSRTEKVARNIARS